MVRRARLQPVHLHRSLATRRTSLRSLTHPVDETCRHAGTTHPISIFYYSVDTVSCLCMSDATSITAISIHGERFVFTAEAAAMTGVSKEYIGRLCRQGKLKSHRFAGQWLVSINSLRALFAKDGKPSHKRMA